MRHSVFAIVILAILPACTDPVGLNAEKDGLCGAQLGQPCTSIQQADNGASLQPYQTFAETQTDKQNSGLTQNTLAGTSSKAKGSTPTIAAGASDGGAPYHVASYRVPERLGTLWLAPRLDNGGVFHEATHVHFVVRGARWGRR